MIVKVKGAGVKLAGKWCFVNETAEIDKEEYEANKEYVEVIQEDVENPKIDEELEQLREKAKELGIKITNNMKKETIMTKIEETEKAIKAQEDTGNPEECQEPEDNQNPEGE